MPFEIFGKIHLDGSSIASGLTRGVGNQLASFGRSVQGQIAALFGTGALINQVRKTVEFASRMTDLSDATGISIERLQELDFAARQNGTTIDALIRATKSLADARMQALANPGGKEARAFGLFGMDQEALRGTTDPSVLMDRLSRSVQGARFDLNSLPQILELVGKKNLEVVPALIAGLEESATMARRLGQVMEGRVARQLDQFGDRVDALQKKLTVGLGPALLKVGELGLESFTGLKIGAAGATAFFDELLKHKVLTGEVLRKATGAAGAAMMGEFIQHAVEQQGVDDLQKNNAVRKLLPGFENADDLFTGAGGGSGAGRSGGSPAMVADNLARIGGFGMNAENKVLEPLNAIARNTADTARNTAGMGELV